MLDDRPIKPNEEYLRQYLQNINKVKIQPFLKMNKHSVLPCHQHNIHQTDQKTKPIRTNNKSKAKLYQEIKQKNKEKFGVKPIIQIKPIQQQPKINPKQMTVNFKPKHIISTEQFKKKDYVKPIRSAAEAEDKDKVQYQKLLDLFKSQLTNLQKQKEQFNKVASKLKFKESIKNQEGLIFTKIKNHAISQLLTSNFTQKQNIKTSNIRQTHCNQNHKSSVCHKLKKQSPQKLSKTISVNEIRQCLSKAELKIQQIKTQLHHRDLTVKQHRYDITQIHLLPTFQPQSLFEYLDNKKLRFNGNQNYIEALNAFNSKFERQSKNEQNIIDEVKNKQGSEIKIKFIDEKRVMKYQGWTQIWIPGKQRLMTNKQGYKVVWLKNGDILQEFPNNIRTYYSKGKDIYKIQFKNMTPVYYHQGLGQLWRYIDGNTREIVFSNGRKQIIQEKKINDF